MEIVRLKNGAEEPAILVMSTRHSLERIFETEPIAFFELVSLCRDRSHELFGNTGEKLAAFGLVDSNGRVHDSVRSIVLASVEGDDWEMQLVSPLA